LKFIFKIEQLRMRAGRAIYCVALKRDAFARRAQIPPGAKEVWSG